jgi:hypothetical protein
VPLVRRAICSFAEVVYLERAEKPAHETIMERSWPWPVARMLRQLGTTLGLRSYTSIARAFGG